MGRIATYKRIVLIMCALAGVSVSLIAHANFTQTLKEGDTHPEVKQLQQFLNIQGFTVAQTGPGSLGNETDYFGPATKNALSRYQEAYKADILTPLDLTTPTGTFGPASRAHANALLTIQSLPPETSTTSVQSLSTGVDLTIGASSTRYLTQQDFNYLIKRIETERKQSLHIADDIEYRSPIESLTGVTLGDATFEDTDASFDTLSVSGNTSLATLTVTATTTLSGRIVITSNTAPADTTDTLYNVGGDLYWAGNLIGGATTGQWTSDGTNVWRAGGNVGIGTSTPSATLAVATPPALPIGEELITNGTFTGNADGWNVGSCFTYGENQLTYYYDGVCSQWQATTITPGTIVGRTYQLSFEVTAMNGRYAQAFGNDADRIGYTDSGGYATGTHSYIFTAGTTGTIWLYPGQPSNVIGGFSIDNISLREMTSIIPAFALYGHDGTQWISLGNVSGKTAFGEGTAGASNDRPNTAFGSNALMSNTTGADNVAVGINSLKYNLTGNGNIAVGDGALQRNVTGNDNTANGYNALLSNTTGSYNTANGRTALYFNTTGSYNTANGVDALYFNTTGSYNTANGVGALYFNTTGSSNTANGVGALSRNTTGSYNTAIGRRAGYSVGADSNYNTFLGYYSGYNMTNGAKNVIVGANAGYTDTALATGTNNILIGYGVGATSSNMSYGLNIGNLIYGTGVNGTGNTLSTGNIGIGTTTPSHKLTVLGDVYASSFIDDGITLTAPDYVFDDPNYFHLSLADIEASTIANAHLPWLTPRGSGPMALSERINEVLEALENLFLHVFDLAKRLVSVEDKNEEQDAEIEALKAEIRTLKGESNQELLLEPQPVEPAEPESGAGETPQPESAPEESATPPSIEEDQPEEDTPAEPMNDEDIPSTVPAEEPAPTEDNTTASPDESAEAEPSTEEPQPTAPPA